MPDDDIMVLNDYGLTRRDRANKSGSVKSRYTVTFKSEPLLVNTDPRSLTKAPAEAIAEHLRQRVRDISATASKATIAARVAAQKALAEGKDWARKRYAGGRIGQKSPNQSNRLFNDSGRFVESIVARATKDGWVVNLAANRLDPSTLDGGEAGLVRVVERLRELVPEWGDASQLVNVLSVQRALRKAIGDSLQKAKERGLELQKQIMRSALGIARELFAAG
jgi:hypothetical protein